MSGFRAAGLTCVSFSCADLIPYAHTRSTRATRYLHYSAAAARFVRAALKPEFRAAAAKREDTTIKIRFWSDGKVTSTSTCSFQIHQSHSISIHICVRRDSGQVSRTL
jgi:hypothetical protein